MSFALLPGLSALADRFDGFILDLWGVIHDGHSAYPHAAATLEALKRQGKKTLLLSNAPRRSYVLIEGMARMGLARDLYGEVMSSGEAVHEALKCRDDPFYAQLGRKCFHLGPERDRSIFDGLDYEIVPLPQADFVLNTGPLDFSQRLDDFQENLDLALACSLPMVCANPDHAVIREGRKILCAGAIAARYEDMGGRVSYRGKPDPAIYDLCLSRLSVPKDRIACVGDSLHTDIAGANAASLASIWVTGGIHGQDLGIGMGEMADAGKAKALAERYGCRPDAAIPAFIW